MHRYDENGLVRTGQLKTRCSEATTPQCRQCGDTSGGVVGAVWQGWECAVCSATEVLHLCARCGGRFEECMGGHEHPCLSVESFRETGRVAFPAAVPPADDGGDQPKRPRRAKKSSAEPPPLIGAATVRFVSPPPPPLGYAAEKAVRGYVKLITYGLLGGRTFGYDTLRLSLTDPAGGIARAIGGGSLYEGFTSDTEVVPRAEPYTITLVHKVGDSESDRKYIPMKFERPGAYVVMIRFKRAVLGGMQDTTLEVVQQP